MGLAPVAYTLWQRFLKFDPDRPHWPNRDRFVLSNGHASMLLYSILHLTGVRNVNEAGEIEAGVAVSLEDIKRFRQLGSRCPGHPEYRHTTGVETTTGPLGQGCGNSVGMAMAQRMLAKIFYRDGLPLFDYDVYAFCSDGDLMEGVASEAASLAGHLKLGNLCWIYDNNNISIEGRTQLAFSEDVAGRFAAYGWRVEHVRDANDCEAFARAVETFKAANTSPLLIIVDSHIAYGAPHKQDTAAAHGEPLGEDEVRLAKRSYGWPEDSKFLVPDGVPEHFHAALVSRSAPLSRNWYERFDTYRKSFPDLARLFETTQAGRIPDGWEAELPEFPADAKGMASREVSGKILNAIAPHYPTLVGGAGDLAPSTKTLVKDGGDFEAQSSGRNLHFGVREHGMGAILNGLVLCGLRPYGATFLIFSDYMKPPIRLASMMRVPVIYVFTHDSIGLGEDGPTHQPVEQLIQLRATPGLITIRPCDANETREAWRMAILSARPVALILSRQVLPTLDRKTYAPAAGLSRGAYVLAGSERDPDVILMGTGSEVSLCLQAHEELTKRGIASRVVSMPSFELFEEQDKIYRDSVLPPAIRSRVSVEAAAVTGWDRYAGPDGIRIGMHSYGASAPYKDVYKHFGITVDHIVAAAEKQIGQHATRL
jgi:transketolase